MHETLIVLLFFIAFAALFDRLRLGTVLGFLIGGAAIGPSGLGVIENLDAVRHFAELGVVFLLFTLGLELKLERLKLFETRVYMLAITQLLVTAVSSPPWPTRLASLPNAPWSWVARSLCPRLPSCSRS